MNRKKGILAAGTLTGLVIITLLGLGFGNLGAATESGGGTAVPQELPQQPQIIPTDPAAEEAVQAWQEYSTDLEETVRVLQERETTYQNQIETANDTIINLQDQINSANSAANSAASSGGYYEDDDDDDRYEDEEHEEHEEHEDHDDDD